MKESANINNHSNVYHKVKESDNIDCNFVVGDRFKLLFDFHENNVKLFYNDENVCVLWKDIPQEIIPAVSVYKCGIKCTSFRGCI